jgi:hypothetical protein
VSEICRRHNAKHPRLYCALTLAVTHSHYALSSHRVAPYQIALHDGRLIFAPQDTDQVIRLRPPAAPDAPSSPEYVPQEEGDEGESFVAQFLYHYLPSISAAHSGVKAII